MYPLHDITSVEYDASKRLIRYSAVYPFLNLIFRDVKSLLM
jgi:hypothetical protein